MAEDVKVDLGDNAKTPPAPLEVWMRYSKILNKWVPCLETDHGAIRYKLAS